MTDDGPSGYLGFAVPTGKATTPVRLDGRIFATNGNEVVMLPGMGGEPPYLALFTDPEAMRVLYEALNIPFDGSMTVENAEEFFDSVGPDIVVICDPHFTEQGTIRFTKVQRETLRCVDEN